MNSHSHSTTSSARGIGMTRRDFVRSGATFLTASAFVGKWSLRAAPNSKLNHACIGVGGMGFVDLQNFLQHPKVQVTAICDVDENHLAKAAELAKGARLYRDWRELLAKESANIDSVNVAVPDHMHCTIAMAAIHRGKNVYCQKPLCHDVAEIRALTKAAAKAKVVTQLGTQMASSVGERSAVQLLRQGAIGEVRRAVLCSNRPGAVETYRLKGPRPAQPVTPPPTLDWDLWIGTAPVRPFAPDIYHPTKWRAWQDFGTGWSGDIGCHIFDAVWKGMKMQPPVSVIAEVQQSWKDSSERRGDTWPQSDHITWTFPGNDLTGGKEWILEWFDGEMLPPADVRSRFTQDEYPPESAMVIGTEGAMLIPLGNRPYLLPEEKFKSLERPKFEPRNHYHHFADACMGGEMTESHFGQTGPMAEAIILGTVAIRTPNTLLKWDSKKLRVTNSTDANKFLRRTYRDGWKVEGV